MFLENLCQIISQTKRLAAVPYSIKKSKLKNSGNISMTGVSVDNDNGKLVKLY